MEMRMLRSLIFAASMFVPATGTAQSEEKPFSVQWTNWQQGITGKTGQAVIVGEIKLSGELPVEVTYHGEVTAPVARGGIDYWYWSPITPYKSTTVESALPTADFIGLSGGSSVPNKLVFSQPLDNPVMAIVSLSDGRPVKYQFDNPFKILCVGCGVRGDGIFESRPGNVLELKPPQPGNTLELSSRHGVIQFVGRVNAISWTILGVENRRGFTLGVRQYRSDPFADEVAWFQPGKPALTKGETHENQALGKPDYHKDTPSLGIATLGCDGQLRLKFTNNVLVDGPGADLRIHGAGRTERMRIYISSNAYEWYELGIAAGGISDFDIAAGGISQFDIATEAIPGERFVYVHIEHSGGNCQAGSLSANIDAVEALNIENVIEEETDVTRDIKAWLGGGVELDWFIAPGE